MNYEVFLWLEPIASILYPVFLAAGIFGLGISILLYGMAKNYRTSSSYLENHPDDKYYWKYTESLKMHAEVIPLSTTIRRWAALLCVVGILVSPLASFTDIYKKILIYRGINSTLADKTIQTADKGLELLNAKIDKELEGLKEKK
jgi:hypothetical protein